MKTVAFVIFSALLTLFGLVYLASGVVPPIMNLTLACDASSPVEQVRAYRFYELIGTNWVLLGSVPTNRITLTNVSVIVPHTYSVTASNVLGESDRSVPYIAPSDPKPPTSLEVIQTSLVVPMNTTIEGTSDLVVWLEKQSFTPIGSNQLLVNFKVVPHERMLFWRERTGGPYPPYPK